MERESEKNETKKERIKKDCLINMTQGKRREEKNKKQKMEKIAERGKRRNKRIRAAQRN